LEKPSMIKDVRPPGKTWRNSCKINDYVFHTLPAVSRLPGFLPFLRGFNPLVNLSALHPNRRKPDSRA
jgi:hypothetical protein